MAEYWNAYLKNGQVTSKILKRGKPIPTGLYHLVVNIIITNDKNEILFSKRAKDKESFPEYYEASAGGSALLGETAKDAIKREVYEELGIFIKTLNLLASYIDEEHHCLFQIFHTQIPSDTTFNLQKEEVSNIIWIKSENIDDFVKHHKIIHSKNLQYYKNN